LHSIRLNHKLLVKKILTYNQKQEQQNISTRYICFSYEKNIINIENIKTVNKELIVTATIKVKSLSSGE